MHANEYASEGLTLIEAHQKKLKEARERGILIGAVDCLIAGVSAPVVLPGFVGGGGEGVLQYRQHSFAMSQACLGICTRQIALVCQ